ncbi:hypothetical protein SAMN05216362_10466 [Piscibacillus halophilus]|uniref:Uncharacterized protein n=1 Tax=Piscibacillus halophilus TaxID=571933 RepID=A0A1H9BTS0_9BACI|nr:hypothetical protein SAMN05216362_10466 [Piscibacillus halophilus]
MYYDPSYQYGSPYYAPYPVYPYSNSLAYSLLIVALLLLLIFGGYYLYYDK